MILWQLKILKIYSKEKSIIALLWMNAIKNSDASLILTEWESFKKLNENKFKKLMKTPIVIDARRILDHSKFTGINFNAIGLGT